MSIKVIIADDHAIVREGIKSVIQRTAEDVLIVAEAANGREVLELAGKTYADVYILDIAMPLLNGIETAGRLMRLNPKTAIIVLSMHADQAFVEQAFRCGVKGYILKEDAGGEVVSAIREVMAGRYFLSPGISGFFVKEFLGGEAGKKADTKNRVLSSREREVLQLIAEGHTTRQIARQLKLSIHTINTHRKSIMGKIGAHRQSELIRYALRKSICCA
jgi:two-component system, NarL family, response regulator NreC